MCYENYRIFFSCSVLRICLTPIYCYPIEFVKYPQAEAKKAEEKAAKAAAKDKVRQ